MRTVSRSLLVLALAVVVASPLVAGDKKKGKHKRRKGHHAAVIHLPKTIQLTAEQKEKVAALRKEFGPKVAALRTKLVAVLTPEQKTARQAAFKEARAAGTKGKGLRKALSDAVQLTKDQKRQMKDVHKEMHALRGEIQTALKKILTPEQQAKFKTRHGKKKKRPAAN